MRKGKDSERKVVQNSLHFMKKLLLHNLVVNFELLSEVE